MATKRMKMRQPATVSDQVRSILTNCGVTRYRIAQATGVQQSTLSYFVSGQRGLSLDALDRIGAYLDLRVSLPPAKRSKAILEGHRTKKGKHGQHQPRA